MAFPMFPLECDWHVDRHAAQEIYALLVNRSRWATRHKFYPELLTWLDVAASVACERHLARE
eukprot:13646128-Alexandrium_andersonii.AAC.1